MFNRCTVRFYLFVTLAVATAASPGSVNGGLQEQLDLEKALLLEDAGRLEEALELYGKVLETAPAEDVSATLYLRMGLCYEKLGRQQARASFQTVVDRYPGQTDQVRQAREGLSRLGASLGHPGSTNSARTARIWTEKSGGVSWAWWSGSTPSPDGRFLTFVDRFTQNLGLRDIATGVLKTLTNLPQPPQAGQGGPVFSPDGRRIAYGYHDQTMSEVRVISVDGGQPQVLFHQDNANGPSLLDWSADGRFILISTWQNFTTNFSMLSAQDGSIRPLVAVENSPAGGLNRARFSPDGRFVVCGKWVSRTGTPVAFPPTSLDQAQSLTSALIVFPVEGGAEIQLADNPDMDREPLWMPDGRTILFLSDRSGLPGLWRISVADGRPQGRPEIVKSDIGKANRLGITRDGTFYYTVYSDRPSLYYAPLDPATGKLAGKSSEVATRSRLSEYQTTGDWSPDGKSIVYIAQKPDVPGAQMLMIRSLADGRERMLPLSQRLTSLWTPKWSADGRSIFIWASGWASGKYGIHRVDIETGESTHLFQTRDDGIEAASAKGLYRVEREGRGTKLVFRDIATGAVTELLALSEPARILGAALSPDASRLGVMVRDADGKSMQVMPSGGGPARTLWTLSAPDNLDGQSLSWTADGRALLCIRFKGAGETASVDRELWHVPADGSDPTYTGLTMEMLESSRAQPNGGGVLFTAGQWTTEFYALENFLTQSKPAPAKDAK